MLRDAATGSIQQRIADLINSNPAEETIPVNNYLDENHSIEEAALAITIKDNAVTLFTADVELRYTPTDGEFSDSTVTLKNSITLKVNENYSKAAEYEAPKNVETKIGSIGLNNSKYYIA